MRRNGKIIAVIVGLIIAVASAYLIVTVAGLL
jgi:hypothetical protein